MTSQLNVDTIAAKDGTSPVGLTKQSAAKAWSNHNMSGTSARASFNIASYLDNAAGDHSITVTSAFGSANYCWSYGGKRATGDGTNCFDVCVVRSVDPTSTVTRHSVKDHDSTSDEIGRAHV